MQLPGKAGDISIDIENVCKALMLFSRSPCIIVSRDTEISVLITVCLSDVPSSTQRDFVFQQHEEWLLRSAQTQREQGRLPLILFFNSVFHSLLEEETCVQ